MKNSAAPLKDLRPFIKERNNMVGTIVFVDDRVDCKVLAVEHRRSFKSGNSKLLELVRPFTSSCTPEYNAETLSLIREKRCLVVFATACASNGIDFQGIRRTIQYGLDYKRIDFCAFIQKIGRARGTEEPCIGVVFAPSKYVLSRLPGDDEDLEDRFGAFREPFDRPGGNMMAQLYSHDPEQKKKKDTHKDGGRKRRAPVEIMAELDPALLWFINTVGCRRRLLLGYFNDPETYSFEIPPGCFCCDVCNGIETIQCTGIKLNFAITDIFNPGVKRKRGVDNANDMEATSADHKRRATERLHIWRRSLWSDSAIFPMNAYAGSDALLSDVWLRKMASRAARITSVDHIKETLGMTQGWNSAILKDHGVFIYLYYT